MDDTYRAEDEPTEVMFCATSIMRSPPVRIAKIGPNFTLPRTVALSTLVAVTIGGLLGVALFVPFVGAGISQIMYSAVFGAGIGVFLINYSPLAGESLLKWFGLTVRHRRRRLERDGRQVKVYVGASQVGRLPDGPVRVVAGAVNVAAGAYDERGALRSARNRNLAETPFRTASSVLAANRATAVDAGVTDTSSALDRWRQLSAERAVEGHMDAFRALQAERDGDTPPSSDAHWTAEDLNGRSGE